MTFPPKSHPAPRGLTAQLSTSSGSDHMRSSSNPVHHNESIRASTYLRSGSPQNAPSCGISCAREMTRIWSSVLMSGERPPCTHRTVPSIILVKRARQPVTESRGIEDRRTAARLSRSKTAQHAFHTVGLPNFVWHSSGRSISTM